MRYPVLFIYTTDFLMLLIPHNTYEHNFLLLLDISSRYDISLYIYMYMCIYIYIYISPCCQIFRLFSNVTIMNNVVKIMLCVSLPMFTLKVPGHVIRSMIRSKVQRLQWLLMQESITSAPFIFSLKAKVFSGLLWQNSCWVTGALFF